ncbi:hypothetical protein SAMN05444401_2211 [Clostridium amylolyticum]|uniref:Spo0E like sporulation regulatory protein n=1 Tax=Clostridium amylolyticum TaxID=1121298 RepID=A0A1M6GRC4_9CLOT|nr:hypothetical protein [Clostridium amylolyticum]SHJ12450.1 hypothetical protein SAMN05444401_2211 [Clostridium amylolyticum]
MEDLDKKLLSLDKHISEIRDILNEISITEEEEDARLMLSEFLDELIVTYMKTLHEKNKELS